MERKNLGKVRGSGGRSAGKVVLVGFLPYFTIYYNYYISL